MDSYFVHWPTFRYEQQIHDMNDLPDTHDEKNEKDLPHYELTRIILRCCFEAIRRLINLKLMKSY